MSIQKDFKELTQEEFAKQKKADAAAEEAYKAYEPVKIVSGSSSTIQALMKEGGLLHGLEKPYQDAMLTCARHFFLKADPQHQWKVQMKDVSDYLVKGEASKEEKELKNPNLSEVRKNKLDALVNAMQDKNHGKDKEIQDKVEALEIKDWITFEQAIQLIKIWDEKDTHAVAAKISDLYKARSELLVIIGIPNDSKLLKDELKTEEQKEEDRKVLEEKARFEALSKEEQDIEKEAEKVKKDEEEKAETDRINKLADHEKKKDKEERDEKYRLKRDEETRALTDSEKLEAVTRRNQRYFDTYKDDIDKINGKGNFDEVRWTAEELAKPAKRDEFEYCLMSIYAKKLRVINALDKRINETLFIKPIIIDMRTTQKQIIKQVYDSCCDCEERAINKLDLYYCGHGHEAYGGWVAGNSSGLESRLQFVRIIDILDTIKNHYYDDLSVEITSESCYSGKQVYKAKEWFEENMDKPGMTNLRVLGSTFARFIETKTETTGKDKNVKTTTSDVYDSVKGIWGHYTLFKYNQTKDGTELQQRKEFQRWYTNQLGQTVFDSTRTSERILDGVYKEKEIAEEVKQGAQQNADGDVSAEQKIMSYFEYNSTDGKPAYKISDQQFPFPIYTNYPKGVLFDANGKVDLTKVTKENFGRQFWKKDQEWNKELIDHAYGEFIKREDINHTNLDAIVAKGTFALGADEIGGGEK